MSVGQKLPELEIIEGTEGTQRRLRIGTILTTPLPAGNFKNIAAAVTYVSEQLIANISARNAILAVLAEINGNGDIFGRTPEQKNALQEEIRRIAEYIYYNSYRAKDARLPGTSSPQPPYLFKM